MPTLRMQLHVGLYFPLSRPLVVLSGLVGMVGPNRKGRSILSWIVSFGCGQASSDRSVLLIPARKRPDGTKPIDEADPAKGGRMLGLLCLGGGGVAKMLRCPFCSTDVEETFLLHQRYEKGEVDL